MHRHLIKNLPSENEIISNWESKDVLLSITCTAYNHANFITESIKGFLIQKTTFPFEIIIHDDASSDDSQSIILKYAEHYPTLIKPILQKKNQWLGQGINATVTFVWPSALGKYIAWCEGDDYWTDPYKIQKQVDFLESNPQVSLCHHHVFRLGQETSINQIEEEMKSLEGNKEYYTSVSDIHAHTAGNVIMTCSIVFRKEIILNLPDWFLKCPIGDYPLCLLAAKQGNIAVIQRPMAVYRTDSGTWSSSAFQKRTALYVSALCLVQQEFADMPVVRAELICNLWRHYLLLEDPSNELKGMIATLHPVTYSCLDFVTKAYHIEKNKEGNLKQLKNWAARPRAYLLRLIKRRYIAKPFF